MSSGSLVERREFLLDAFTVCLFVVLFLGSFYFTGAPYLAGGVAIGVPVIAWACMKPKRLVYLLVVWCCLYPYLESDLGMSRMLSYGGDLINLLALLFSLREKKLRTLKWGWVPLPIFLNG